MTCPTFTTGLSSTMSAAAGTPWSGGPVLLNSWEAAYMDFDAEKLLRIARSAKELGVELFVIDDGWFGNRDDDFRGLGDWFVNEKKLPGGLKVLLDSIHALGLKTGLWLEPEMVSEDSDLYRSHPDWALTVPAASPPWAAASWCWIFPGGCDPVAV